MSDFPEIPGFTLISLLGEGGMAKVYMGIQEKIGRKVAIKILNPVLLKKESSVKRFNIEAKTTSQLSHSNIVTIYETGRNGDYCYIAMEVLEESLKDRMKSDPQKRVPPKEALRITKDVVTALDYAHFKGIYHRDIKPENIMFRRDNTTVLVDFGVAHIFDSIEQLTQSGIIMGSVHYLSPEQCTGAKDIDGRCDFYSLGAVFYQMLAGEIPYDGNSSMSILYKHMQQPIPRLPEELSLFQPLINAMMEKDRNLRISSLPQFEQVLHTLNSLNHSCAPFEATVLIPEAMDTLPPDPIQPESSPPKRHQLLHPQNLRNPPHHSLK